MSRMLGEQGAPHMPENVGQQRDIFWSVDVTLWRVASFKSSLGAARHSPALRLRNDSESRLSQIKTNSSKTA